LSFILCALDVEMADAWSTCFGSEPNVFVHQQDILTRTADAILSPANSFGFMDGGIDLLYSNFFGWELQDRLRKSIREEHAGEVPIGCAVVVPTDHDRIPLLVSAPTMRVPGDISDTVNVYLAFRAALLAVRSSTRTKSLLSPALGTGIGGMSARRAAKQMHAAYVDVVLGEHGWRSTARGVLTHHAKLFAD
jgi:O-acetyl-ADP-ribose deacetylase (regulator of RNase III)